MSIEDDTQPEDMLPAERRQRLQDWLIQNMAGTNQDLARLFNTSVSTIRRDLDHLAAQGVVRRTHGGAVSVRRRAIWEPTSDMARQIAIEEKRAIAQEAAKRLEPDQSILIDTGSTLHEFAKIVAGLDIPLTVVTSDMFVAGILANKPHIKLVVPGGVCREGAYTLLGEPGLSFLTDLHCDKLFLCVQAVDLKCVSDTTVDLVNLKRAMIKAAEATILMVDSSKFGSRAIYRVADLDTIDEIITDDGISADELARLGEIGAKVTCAAVNAADDTD